MTSRREAETGFHCKRFLAGLVALALGACATLPQDHPVYEQLDAETGVTIALIGKPIELYRETVPNVYTDRFAFLAPFETNQMGTREAFLWLAVPIDPTLAGTVPTLDVDGNAQALGTPGRQAGWCMCCRAPGTSWRWLPDRTERPITSGSSSRAEAAICSGVRRMPE